MRFNSPLPSQESITLKLHTNTMPKRISKLSNSLKRLGDIQVTEWDLKAVMHTDIKELEVTRALRRLGAIRVMDWDFRSAMQAVRKSANQEVDIVTLVKRAASYKVTDWDFRSAWAVGHKPASQVAVEPLGNRLSQAEMQAITIRLKNFLQYVVVNLIDDLNHAQIKVTQMGPTGLRFKLVLMKKNVAMLIGREGFTASAIRNILQAAAGMNGVQALLHIHSHEDEMAFVAQEEARRQSGGFRGERSR